MTIGMVECRREELVSLSVATLSAFYSSLPPLLLAVASEEEQYGELYGRTTGPETWKGRCSDGQYQSPINVPQVPETDKLQSGMRVEINYPRFTRPACRINASGSPQLEYNSTYRGSKASIIVEGRRYILRQVHFHVPSEHSISGTFAPAEAHLVHEEEQTGDILVIAVLMKVGPSPNSVLASALECAASSKQASTKSSMNMARAIDLVSLLPPSRDVTISKRPFAAYYGSLTTPPCSEKVLWLVFLDSVSVTSEQVLDLVAYTGKRTYNARPQQALNDREIIFSS